VTVRVLLLGYPLDHSLSPAFQNAAFRTLGLDHCYETEPLASFESERVGALLRAEDVLGANVTLPYKRDVMSCLDELTPEAIRIDAVNTVFREGSALVGHNTDLGGFLADLDEVFPDGALTRAVVLGAGGAARAVVAGLVGREVEVLIWNRTAERAATLAEDLGATAVADPGVLARADLVVDATSIGVANDALVAPWPLELTRPDCFFYDLKYGPESPFLSAAKALGRPCAGGLGMLVRQGALAFACWTGRPAPLDAMWGAARAALQGHI